MNELPPTTASKPTGPDESDRTMLRSGSVPEQCASGASVAAGAVIAGKYTLLETLGEGGMGAVWMAEQTDPIKRLVAVKLIKAGLDSKAVVVRFEAERQALSMMDHPHIARVIDVGATEAGRPYLVMELVKGMPITEFCDSHRLAPKRRLALFVQVCDAIQHAHQKGIIHRDIKPSNVLVTLHEGVAVPKVIDFGVAKAIGTTLTDKTLHTGFEQVIGTPSYMSPEQAGFNQLDIDTRSDVYSLGVLLYELLTGTTPIERERFRRLAIDEMLRVVREEDPPRPSTRVNSLGPDSGILAACGTEPVKLSNDLRGELDWIALKALEKDRTRRYETANALSRDVQRHLADEVVEARPPSRGYRIRKFVRRHKGRVVAACIIVLALLGGSLGAIHGVTEAGNQRVANALREQAERERDAAAAARDGETKAKLDAERARDGERAARTAAESARSGEEDARRAAESTRDELADAREKLARVEYGRSMQVALQEWKEGNSPAARTLIRYTREDLRGWEWQYLSRVLDSNRLTVHEPNGVTSAEYSPDGSRIVLGTHGRNAVVYDARTGAKAVALGYHQTPVNSASFSADGLRIVTASDDATARVWDANTGAFRRILRARGPIRSASFHPDGTRVVGACADHTARIWDASTGAELQVLKGHAGEVSAASFNRDGSRIVTASDDKSAKVWDAQTGVSLFTLHGHADKVRSACFNREGTRIVTAGMDATARVWDAKTGTELLVIRGHALNVLSASFSPDGQWVATSGSDTTLRVWNAATGEHIAPIRKHGTTMFSVSFSPDGSRILAGSLSKTALVWDAGTGGDLVFRTHSAGVNAACLSPDGLRLATAGTDKTAKIWNTVTGACLLTFTGHPAEVWAVAFSPDGSRVVTGSSDKTARVWDPRTGESLLRVQHAAPVRAVAFNHDGTQIFTASDDKIARISDADTGKTLATIKLPIGAHSAFFSPDGKRVVTTGRNTVPNLWDATTGDTAGKLTGHDSWVSSAAFNTDGSRLITASRDNKAMIWNAEATTPRVLHTLRGHTGWVHSAAISRDGSRVVTGSADRSAKVWDAKTGAELLTLKGHASAVIHVCFTTDGSRIVTTSQDGTTRVWDARPAIPNAPAPPPRPR